MGGDKETGHTKGVLAMKFTFFLEIETYLKKTGFYAVLV